MKCFILVSIIFFALPIIGRAQAPDSIIRSSRQKVVVRLHSAGLFSYSGRIVSTNPVADVGFNYDRRHWGYSLFKAQDLIDGSTPINFMLSGFYTNLKIGKKITITPFLAFRCTQATSLADKGSDASFILTMAYHIHPNLTIDNSSLFSNTWLERKNFDWVNRFRLLYASKHLDFGLMAWNNTHVFDQNHYVSGGINVAYNRMKILNHLSLGAGITGIAMLNTSDEVQFPKQNTIYFTLSVLIQ